MDKALLVNIVLLIHMALTGIMLFRLFKLKNATGGQLILTFVALTIPILGPSALIAYYNKETKKQKLAKENIKSTAYAPRKNYSKRKKS
ncbi:MAG: hypothetical protein ACI35V_11955 [Sphingobacterium composti]|uniref:hypothetical protein n=1 Tax=Sphingobacterium composti TaxID=363260 RepID=UPI001356A65D|nr:hypothetical protein [Sphingobacterium composti Ten et al. 2007 non Yoo et al. 2007]